MQKSSYIELPWNWTQLQLTTSQRQTNLVEANNLVHENISIEWPDMISSMCLRSNTFFSWWLRVGKQSKYKWMEKSSSIVFLVLFAIVEQVEKIWKEGHSIRECDSLKIIKNNITIICSFKDLIERRSKMFICVHRLIFLVLIECQD